MSAVSRYSRHKCVSCYILSVNRVVVVIRRTKRSTDTGIAPDTGIATAHEGSRQDHGRDHTAQAAVSGQAH